MQRVSEIMPAVKSHSRLLWVRTLGNQPGSAHRRNWNIAMYRNQKANITCKQDVTSTIDSPKAPRWPAKVHTIAMQKTPTGVLVVGFLSM